MGDVPSKCSSCGVDPAEGKGYLGIEDTSYFLCESCFIKEESKCELSFTESPSGQSFFRHSCDACGVARIVGYRYEAMSNKNYNLCQGCFEDYTGDETAGFEEHPTGNKIDVHAGHTCNSCHRSPILRNRYQATSNKSLDLCLSCLKNYSGEELDFVEHPSGETIYRRSCDSCEAFPISGKRRYQSLHKKDYNLCAKCFNGYKTRETHFEEHPSGKTFSIKFRELDRGDMGKPIRAKLFRFDSLTDLGEAQDKSEPTPVAERGITLRQLRAVFSLVCRMCHEGTMMSTIPGQPPRPLSLEEVTLYDINANIILPFTEKSKKSFVETLPSTAGTQPPRWFVSHWWGERFTRTMACIEELYWGFEQGSKKEHIERGGGMREDTPVWICAFANNQHDLADITEDPAKSGFAQALEVANYRTMSILDEAGKVFTRIWCIEELYLTHTLSQANPAREEGIWAAYTYIDIAHSANSAVGIVEGGTPRDIGEEGTQMERGESELEFPAELLLKALDVKVQRAQASLESDRRHILNSIAQIGLDENPFEEHENYDWLNDVVRGTFATKMVCILAAHRKGRDEWQRLLTAIGRSSPEKFVLDFQLDSRNSLQVEEVIELLQHLPNCIKKLSVTHNPFGPPVIDAVTEFIETRGENLRELQISNHRSCRDLMRKAPECGARLAEAIGECKTLKELDFHLSGLVGSLNGSAWKKAVKQNTSLNSIDIDFETHETTNTEKPSERLFSRLQVALLAATSEWSYLQLDKALRAATKKAEHYRMYQPHPQEYETTIWNTDLDSSTRSFLYS